MNHIMANRRILSTSRYPRASHSWMMEAGKAADGGDLMDDHDDDDGDEDHDDDDDDDARLRRLLLLPLFARLLRRVSQSRSRSCARRAMTAAGAGRAGAMHTTSSRTSDGSGSS